MSVFCNCREIAVKLQVKSNTPNKGRYFWGCRGRKCKFFKWDNEKVRTNTYVPNQHQGSFEVEPPFCQPHQVVCVRRTSHSERNPNRPYFACPSARNCLFEWEDEWKKKNPGGSRKTSIDCQLSSRTSFSVFIPQFAHTRQIEELLKGMGATKSEGMLGLPMMKYEKFKSNIETHPVLKQYVKVNVIPKKILDLVCSYSIVNIPDMLRRLDWSKIPKKIRKCAHQFQREGIAFGVARGGKYFLADEMGLGKTLQAIAVSSYFKKDWPLLVICPSSLKTNWGNEFMTWLRKDRKPMSGGFINIIWSGRDRLSGKINIISYDLVVSMKKKIEGCNFQSIIVDETHYLKNSRTQRCTTIIPIIQRARRAIMITGTPALSRPVELYSQLSAIFSPSPLGNTKKKRKDPWVSRHTYIFRYCNAFDTGSWVDDSGASNLLELNVLLTNTVMVRRLKKDVLTQLPPKVRSSLWVNIPASAMKDIKKSMSKVSAAKKVQRAQRNSLFSSSVPQFTKEEMTDSRSRKGKEFMRMYRVAGMAKLHVMKKIIQDKLKHENQRFLIYGHHLNVLDGLEDIVKGEKVDYIRIDGSCPPQKRAERADRFRRDPKCKVAILSVTACGTGLTLTPCSNVIFAELTWTPGALKQAEDRVHRIGQKNCVNIQYVLAKGTVDEQLWAMIQSKLDIVGDALGDQGGQDGNREMWETRKARASQGGGRSLFVGGGEDDDDDVDDDDDIKDIQDPDRYLNDDVKKQDFDVQKVFSKPRGARVEEEYQRKETIRKRNLVKKKYGVYESPGKTNQKKKKKKSPPKKGRTQEPLELSSSGEEALYSQFRRDHRDVSMVKRLDGGRDVSVFARNLRSLGVKKTDLSKKKKEKKKKRKKKRKISQSSDDDESSISSSSSESSSSSDSSSSSSSSSSDDDDDQEKEKEQQRRKRKKKKKRKSLSVREPPPSLPSSDPSKKKKKQRTNQSRIEEEEEEVRNNRRSFTGSPLPHSKKSPNSVNTNQSNNRNSSNITNTNTNQNDNILGHKRKYDDTSFGVNSEQRNSGRPLKRMKLDHNYSNNNNNHQRNLNNNNNRRISNNQHPNISKLTPTRRTSSSSNIESSNTNNNSFRRISNPTNPKPMLLSPSRTQTPSRNQHNNRNVSNSSRRNSQTMMTSSKRHESLQRSLERGKKRRRREEEKKRMMDDVSADNIFARFQYTPPPPQNQNNNNDSTQNNQNKMDSFF